MITGKRRLVAYLSANAMTIAPDMLAGIGLSMHTASVLIVLGGAYFGGVAVDKFKNGADDGKEG